MKIYVVQGTCGEYSDRQEWLICAYEEKHLAITHVEGAQMFTSAHATDPYKDAPKKDRPDNPWDPHGYYDRYDTPRYWHAEIDLKKMQ